MRILVGWVIKYKAPTYDPQDVDLSTQGFRDIVLFPRGVLEPISSCLQYIIKTSWIMTPNSKMQGKTKSPVESSFTGNTSVAEIRSAPMRR